MSIRARFQIRRGSFDLDVDLELPSRGVTGLFGPSGCGKTTLLRALAGLDRHSGGRLEMAGRVWQGAQTFVPTHQRALGYVFQEAGLFDHLNVRKNLEYGAKRAPQTDLTLDETIQLLDLQTLLDRRPSGLSGGERQRVAIARALAAGPELLLMDEPLASLDQGRKQEILPFIDAVRRRLHIPMIYVSHASDEMAQIADHLVILKAGRVDAEGPITDLLTRLDLSLAQGDAAESLIEADVAEHDECYGLTYLDSPAGRFTVERRRLDIGSPIRLRIAARDVSLTLEPQSGTSILNIFPARVDELQDHGVAQSTVRLSVGEGVPLLARVTRKSAAELQLAPGTQVFAQVKSVALPS